MAGGTTVAILQSNYIPWKGYFDLIARVDEFVLYDDVQYTRRDWRNRNRIKTAQGPMWLTIPVRVGGRYLQRIRDVEVEDAGWAEKHWRSIVHHYAAAAAAGDHRGALEELYRTAPRRWLTEINEHFLRGICGLLHITTRLRRSSELDLGGDRSERLVNMCRQLGASTYVSGPSASTYLDASRFQAEGIDVVWADYSGYQEYRQLHPPFDHHVSIVDLLMNEGREARKFLKHA
jgi:WbqC-like protein family